MKRSLFFALSLVISFSAAANAGPSLKELLDGAEKVNDLKGPFGARHRWDQYVDAQTASLEFRFQGNVYSWRDIHSRVSFFKHGALRDAAKGKDISAVDTDDYTTTVILVDDAGTFYLAGWRNFADDELSVFSIAPVDTELLGKVAAEAVDGGAPHVEPGAESKHQATGPARAPGGRRGRTQDAQRIQKDVKKYTFDKSHIATLAQDQGLSIILQRNSEKQRAGKLGVDVQPRLGNETDVKYLADIFSSSEEKVDLLKKYIFPTGEEGGNFKVSATPETLHVLDGCDIEKLGSDFFESSFKLSSLGTCFYLKSGLAEKHPDLAAPYTLWSWFNDAVAANPISAGPHPSELSEDSARKTRYSAGTGHADASVWTSWYDYPNAYCKTGRDVSKGDWIVINYEFVRDDGYNHFLQFDERSLKTYPDQFHYAISGGPVPWFKDGECDFPVSISISVYYNMELISESHLTRSFVLKNYKSDVHGIGFSTVMNRRDYLNKFLLDEVGADIWRYAENLR